MGDSLPTCHHYPICLSVDTCCISVLLAEGSFLAMPKNGIHEILTQYFLPCCSLPQLPAQKHEPETAQPRVAEIWIFSHVAAFCFNIFFQICPMAMGAAQLSVHAGSLVCAGTSCRSFCMKRVSE